MRKLAYIVILPVVLILGVFSATFASAEARPSDFCSKHPNNPNCLTTSSTTTTTTTTSTTTTPPPPLAFCGSGAYWCWSADNANWNVLGEWVDSNTTHWNNARSNQPNPDPSNGVIAPWITRVAAGDGTQAVRLLHQPSCTGCGGWQTAMYSGANTRGYTQGRLNGSDRWYRFRIRYPTEYHPSPNSQWNISWEPSHTDGVCSGMGGNSTYLGVTTRTSDGGGEKLLFNRRTGYCNSYSEFRTMMPLTRNLWYDVVSHIYWHTDCGIVQIWINGSQFVNDNCVQTVYRRSATDSTPDSGGSNGIYDYQDSIMTNPSSTDFDWFSVGPTAASVGFTP